MKQHKRLLAWSVCIGMILVLSASSACIARGAAHDCIGEECAVCESIARAETVLLGFLLAGVVSPSVFALLSLTHSVRRDQSACCAAVSTPVSRKVRLND